MSATDISWLLSSSGAQPTGPFSTTELMQRLQTRTLNPATLCWREGMAEWQPLFNTPPFQAVIEQLAVTRLRRAGRLVLIAECIGLVALIAGFYYWYSASFISKNAIIFRQEPSLFAIEFERLTTQKDFPYSNETYCLSRHSKDNAYVKIVARIKNISSNAARPTVDLDLKTNKDEYLACVVDCGIWRTAVGSNIKSEEKATVHAPSENKRASNDAEAIIRIEKTKREKTKREALQEMLVQQQIAEQQHPTRPSRNQTGNLNQNDQDFSEKRLFFSFGKKALRGKT